MARASSSSLVALAFLVAVAADTQAAVWVSRARGSHQSPGTKEKPLELISSDEALSARSIVETPTVFQPTNEAGGEARKAFLSARYTEQVDFNPDSPANLWRQAMGLNKRGEIDSAVTMFMNRYPWRDTLRLLGAMKDHGAQGFE